MGRVAVRRSPTPWQSSTVTRQIPKAVVLHRGQVLTPITSQLYELAGQKRRTIKTEGNFTVEFESSGAEAGVFVKSNCNQVGGFDAKHDPIATGLRENLVDQKLERLRSQSHCLEPVVNHKAINPLVAIIAIERNHSKAYCGVATSDQ